MFIIFKKKFFKEKLLGKWYQKKGSNKGAVSVYVCLIIAFLIPVLLMIIGLSKYFAMQVEVECACNLATDSITAEYNRDLLEDYGLLFIDTSYFGECGSLDKTLEHLNKYLEKNLKPDDSLSPVGGRNLFGFEVLSTEITKASRATDDDGAVLRYMADEYMLDRYGISLIDEVKNMVSASSNLKLNEIDINKDNDKAQKDIQDFKPQDEGEGGEWNEANKEDPAKGVSELRAKGILGIVVPGIISGTSIETDNYASHRNLVVGDGLTDAKKNKKLNSIEEKLLFNEYIMIFTGNYRTGKDISLLSYQTEYIICGKDSDEKNLKDIVNKLILLRGASNTVYYLTDVEKHEETLAMAETLSAATGCPLLTPLYQAAIDLAWIYAESVVDVKKLMKGECVPLVTTYEDWDLALENVINNTEEAFDDGIKTSEKARENEKEIGSPLEMKYSDYLRLLLYMQNEKEKNMRLMDVIEMDIRYKNGNSNFKLDNCICDYTVQIGIESDSGYEYFYERACGY